MKAKIQFTRLWFDDDVIELQIKVNDGRSSFINTTYTCPSEMQETLVELRCFKENICSADITLKFGTVGPEFANGAFQAIINGHPSGKIYISTYQQSNHFEFLNENVASEARLFLRTEPALLDSFVAEFTILCTAKGDQAILECVEF